MVSRTLIDTNTREQFTWFPLYVTLISLFINKGVSPVEILEGWGHIATTGPRIRNQNGSSCRATILTN